MKRKTKFQYRFRDPTGTSPEKSPGVELSLVPRARFAGAYRIRELQNAGAFRDRSTGCGRIDVCECLVSLPPPGSTRLQELGERSRNDNNSPSDVLPSRRRVGGARARARGDYNSAIVLRSTSGIYCERRRVINASPINFSSARIARETPRRGYVLNILTTRNRCE